MAKVDPQRLAGELAQLQGWLLSDDGLAIEKQFVFKDFRRAFAFMTAAALTAERMDHHPEWSNVYRRVNVRLTTHSESAVTDLDLTLARAMDEIAGA